MEHYEMAAITLVLSKVDTSRPLQAPLLHVNDGQFLLCAECAAHSTIMVA